ncbi:MAG: lysophospholipid acyltransferase family protein [Crocinitomicaceae bacterium]|nr:lysophospholipid acyltransferase family protein [Crocinitomicaceae bacterium]MBK8925621.1 lysophospholipid acyltransferase family protein [Crocinitomicaceae bacterium]
MSYMPLGLLYAMSSVVAFLTYYLVRYRRKVVRRNLTAAFPEKTIAEITAIEKGFYLHFTDFIMESIKAISISERQLSKRTSIKNPELLEKYYAAGKNILVTCGHYNNWEFYALSLPRMTQYKTYSVYQPLKNTFYDKILYNSRVRNGMKLIRTKELIPFFSVPSTERRMVVIVNDQSPSNIQTAHWNTFLNQPTGWNIGPEKLARKYDYAVLFGYSRRIRRGVYEVEFSVLSENPTAMPEGAITDVYSQILEKLITEKPQFWLWSHKRWKHPQPLKHEKPVVVSQQIAS